MTGRLVKKEKDGLELTLYMTNPAGKETVIFEGREQVNHLKNLICLGAEAVLRNTEPYILADYLLQYEPFLAQEELRSILRDTTFQRDHKWAYVAWGQLLSDAGLYDNALKFYRSALEEDENFEVALNNIGASYSHGKGVLKDHVTAKAYYEKASRNGYTGARYNLGVLMHQDGDQRGIGILEDLANRDDAYALGYLGRKFPQKHLAYLKRAAYLGNKLAQSLLGVFYVLGQYGLPMDLQMASYWLRKGAAGAESLAEFALADIYSAGADRAKLVEAYAWAQVAAIHSSGQEALHQQDLAKKNGIKVKLTDTELSAARDMLIRAGFPADEDPDLSRGDNRFLKMRPFRPDSERGDSCR